MTGMWGCCNECDKQGRGMIPAGDNRRSNTDPCSLATWVIAEAFLISGDILYNKFQGK